MDVQKWQRRAPHPFPPSWASAWGDDAYGLWADAGIGLNDPPVVQRMRWIEPGQFLMGSPQGELDAQDREHPQHLVTLSQGLWLADTACTQAAWQVVIGSNLSYFDETKLGSPEHPVEDVTWLMAQEFLTRLENLLPGCQATLPTEAEWEYACRAGTTTPFSFGETISPEQVNYDGNFAYGNDKQGKYRARTIAVKELPPNIWGFYQMHGNVWEWCADSLRNYTAQSETDPGLTRAVEPLAGAKDIVNAVRGGSWLNPAQLARSALRTFNRCDWHRNDLGFRFALRSKS